MKILLFDNYDSFTYNLYHCVKQQSDAHIDVFRNDRIDLADIRKYDKIILSPGPGLPAESGILLPLIKEYAPAKSILGVCLGHQAIGESFGGKLKLLDRVFHGVSSVVERLGYTPRENDVFSGIDGAIEVGRYHSWTVDRDQFPAELEITAVDPQREIMALRHRKFDVQGVQFHPESIMTPTGNQMIKNFLKN